MSIKVIAIGNRMMGDDGIALYVAERLYASLAEMGIEVVLGETDIDFCMGQIADKDKLIIIDGACSGRPLGSISSRPLQKAVEDSSANSWQHDRDLVRELRIRGIAVSGLLLCIEVHDIDFRWGLSKELQKKLPEICHNMYDLILGYVKVLSF